MSAFISDAEREAKLTQIKEAWKGKEFADGLIFKYTFDYFPKAEYDGVEWDNLPTEAFEDKATDIWVVAWKATINGKKYGNYIKLTEPVYTPALEENYRQAREEIMRGVQ